MSWGEVLTFSPNNRLSNCTKKMHGVVYLVRTKEDKIHSVMRKNTEETVRYERAQYTLEHCIDQAGARKEFSFEYFCWYFLCLQTKLVFPKLFEAMAEVKFLERFKHSNISDNVW